MVSLPSSFTAADWIAVGLLALVPAIMILGISAVRKEIRKLDRSPGSYVRTKTTALQRRKWRESTGSQELIDLLDDIDMLLDQVERGLPTPRRDHREAMRLAWKSLHVPWGTVLTFGLLLICILSAVLTMLAQGPANPIP
jgi:hypothetical protein